MEALTLIGWFGVMASKSRKGSIVGLHGLHSRKQSIMRLDDGGDGQSRHGSSNTCKLHNVPSSQELYSLVHCCSTCSLFIFPLLFLLSCIVILDILCQYFVSVLNSCRFPRIWHHRYTINSPSLSDHFCNLPYIIWIFLSVK